MAFEKICPRCCLAFAVLAGALIAGCAHKPPVSGEKGDSPRIYRVNVGTLTNAAGSVIIVYPPFGPEGTWIRVGISAVNGYRLKPGTLRYNGTQGIDETALEFALPAGDVTITAEFEAEAAKPWNREPVVTGSFFDDFSSGIDRTVWVATTYGWGEANNGTSPDNVLFSTDSAQAAAGGAESGGIVVLRANGDYHEDPSRRRQGASLLSRRAFGPGKYEVRMKVVPRLGQCTAAWTYWNGGGATVETNRYSEIDIEMLRDADYRQWSGTAYKYFYDWNTLAVRRDGVVKRAGLNDGNWHTYGFEWRTDAENGDEGVRWYMDGVQVLDIRGYTPLHTAHFQLGAWFPNEPSWVGIPDFEEAYMYVDWVRITGYDDPVTIGAVATEGGGDPVDLGKNPLPRNNYISNGMFKRFSGGAFTGWEKTAGAAAPQGEGGVMLTEEARIAQLIRGQYSGYRFDLTVDAQVTAGNGALTARVE
ncbi:MAG: glycoside hydrolase family 16 protein, partial [Treponema sp.]|nr:glycoside hydrolase family 16 protein [Treponema sp.]